MTLTDALYANLHDGQRGGTMTVSVDDHVKETVEVVTDYLYDDEFEGTLQRLAIAEQGDSNDLEIAILREALDHLLVLLGKHLLDRDDFDESSSASRQHRIDTGRYLRKDEVDA